MKLKKDEKLELSSVVANNRMNRGRRLNGVNSYKQDINFDVLDYLKERLAKEEEVRWMDLCCGEGKALIEGRASLNKEIPE